LTELALRPDAGIEDIEPYVVDTGEGRWTLQEAIERSVPLPVLAVSLFERFASRDQEKFADRLLAALRNQFGGHAVERLSDVHGAEAGADGEGAGGAGGASGGASGGAGASSCGAAAGGAGAGGAAAGGGGAGGSGAS
jgi:6-phosphogluconate dehydrogenase